MNISLIKPDIRLRNVSVADCVKPLIKKEQSYEMPQVEKF